MREMRDFYRGLDSGPQQPAPPPTGQRHDGYVQHAHPQCQDGGCQFARASGLLAAAAEVIQQGKVSSMSQALWCDRGGHAFSDRDPGRKRVAVAGLDDDGNEQDAQYEDICGECIEKSGLLRKARTRPAAQLPGRYDQARTEDLEREPGMRDGNG